MSRLNSFENPMSPLPNPAQTYTINSDTYMYPFCKYTGTQLL